MVSDVVSLNRHISIELLQIETAQGEMHKLKWNSTPKVQIVLLKFPN